MVVLLVIDLLHSLSLNPSLVGTSRLASCKFSPILSPSLPPSLPPSLSLSLCVCVCVCVCVCSFLCLFIRVVYILMNTNLPHTNLNSSIQISLFIFSDLMSSWWLALCFQCSHVVGEVRTPKSQNSPCVCKEKKMLLLQRCR